MSVRYRIDLHDTGDEHFLGGHFTDTIAHLLDEFGAHPWIYVEPQAQVLEQVLLAFWKSFIVIGDVTVTLTPDIVHVYTAHEGWGEDGWLSIQIHRDGDMSIAGAGRKGPRRGFADNLAWAGVPRIGALYWNEVFRDIAICKIGERK